MQVWRNRNTQRYPHCDHRWLHNPLERQRYPTARCELLFQRFLVYVWTSLSQQTRVTENGVFVDLPKHASVERLPLNEKSLSYSFTLFGLLVTCADTL